MNLVVLTGRLAQDPEVRYTQTGKAVAQFNLAVNRPFTDKDGQRGADFFPIVIWGKSAETAGNNLTKGNLIEVTGRLQTRSYDDKQGIKRYVTEVVTNHFGFLEKKKSGNGGNAAQSSPMNDFGTEVFPEEEIPF